LSLRTGLGYHVRAPLLFPSTLDMTMSDIPGDLKFLKSHEWARLEDDGLVRVGISDHAQSQLGDLVYVELPEVGTALVAGNGAAVLESVKAASDIYAPVSGEVVEVNELLAEKPELINEDAYGTGWIYALRPSDRAELDELLDVHEYEQLLESEES
jgi:glycine cleavage system H protein